jgi:hypothetical protein
MSLPMRLALKDKDDLGIEPAGNTMELAAEIDAKKSQMVELRILRSPSDEEYTLGLHRPQADHPHSGTSDE